MKKYVHVFFSLEKINGVQLIKMLSLLDFYLLICDLALAMSIYLFKVELNKNTKRKDDHKNIKICFYLLAR